MSSSHDSEDQGPQAPSGGGLESPSGDGPRIVAFGGGTGMSSLLAGLKQHSANITAIVTVTDNGGSSGRLRKEFDMVPPGDIRSCQLALADGDAMFRKLLHYRFEESDLKGHSFGNLVITALTKLTGSFDLAVRELNRMLDVRGNVLPATARKISLIAHHSDGTKSTGEVQVSSSGKPIVRVEIRPRVRTIASDVRDAIAQAELMILGPGSLFTSVIPNLLVEGILEEIRQNPCPKVYVANIMTQPGETTGLDLRGHLKAIADHGGDFLSSVVVHRGGIADEVIQRYSEQGSALVAGIDAVSEAAEVEIVSADLLDRNSDTVRHDPDRLGDLIAERFLPELCRKNP